MILPTPTIIIMEFIYFVFGSHDMILAEWLLAVVLKRENSKSTVAPASALFHCQVHFFDFFYIQVFLPNF